MILCCGLCRAILLAGVFRMTETRLSEKRLTQARSYFVVKANELASRSRYSLTLQQQKILAYLIAQIKPDDEPDTLYELDIKDFIWVCGLTDNSGHYYQTIKKDIDIIDNVKCYIEVPDGKRIKEVRFRWLDRIEMNRGTGKIYISFHHSVSHYLFGLIDRNVGRIQYEFLLALCFTKEYTGSVYEYCLRNKYRGVVEVELEWFKKHISAEKYVKISHFKDRALEPAIEDINTYSDIIVDVNYKKTGRVITHLILSIRDKTDTEYLVRGRIADRKLNPETRKERREIIKRIEEKLNQEREETADD